MNLSFNTIFSICFFLTITIFSNKNVDGQSINNGILFQAVARDNFSNPAMDRKIHVQTSIIQTVTTGTKVLIEEFQTSTDATGVFNISIGQGTRIGGTSNNLIGIDWAQGPYFLNLKIAITPIAPTINWDYKNEWIDLGTTNFGVVPYALYAGSAAGLKDKLNINDTSSMLAIYAKAQSLMNLENKLGTKLTSADTIAMLAPYKKIVNEIISSNITSLTADVINSSLDSKVNLIDSNKIYVTPLQLAAKTFDITPINTSIATKLNISDSISHYITPTQLAASTFNPSEIYKAITSKADTSEITSLIKKKVNLKDFDRDLSFKVDLADSTIKYVTPAQLAAKTFDITPINISIASKVDKIAGKELSTNDYTNTEKQKLAQISGLNTGDQDLSMYATSAQMNLKLNSTDTAAMLSNRFNTDTSSLSNRINLKLNISDTSDMLTNRINRDTSSLSNRINLKLNISDTSNMLTNRINRDTASLSNRINLKANNIDVTNDLSLKANSTDVTNSLNLKLNSTDTAAMLSNRLNRDTSSLSNRINFKLNISDTSDMLTNRINRDTASLSNRINLKANSIDVTTSLALKANVTDVTNSLNLKLNSTDTAAMLSNRFNRDTSSLSNRINLKANSIDVTNDLALKQTIITAGTTSQFYRGDKTWQTITYSTIGAAPLAGSTSITTLGTIATGTWNATTISVTKGGTGATTLTANAVLLGNGTSALNAVAPSTSGNVLTSDGTTWVSSTPSVTLIREVANEFSATNAQTTFTLTQTPSVNSKVKMYINGVRISNTAYSLSGNILTYNATNNGAYSLMAGDRIQFDYYY